MKQLIIFKIRKLFFDTKKIAKISCFFISIFFIHAPLFSQTKPDVMAKAVKDSSKEITIPHTWMVSSPSTNRVR